MILNFLGWLYIVMGIILLLKPEKMRSKFRNVALLKLRQYFSVLALIIGLLLIKATWGLEGFLAKLFLIAGFIALAKAVFLFKAKSADRVIQWWLDKDIGFFRTSAIVQIVVGGLLLSL
jgi:hypothetical protein